MSQTVHNVSPTHGTEGQIIDGREVISAVVDSTNGVIPFGRALTFKTLPAPGKNAIVELPNATGEITGDNFAGISVRDPTVELPQGSNVFTGFKTGDVISLLRRGRLWVVSEDAVSARVPVFARFVAGGGEELGALRTDADTADAVAIPGSKFMTSGGAGAVVEMELDVQD